MNSLHASPQALSQGVRLIKLVQGSSTSKQQLPQPSSQALSCRVVVGQAEEELESLQRETNVGEVSRLLKQLQYDKVPERFHVKDWNREGNFVPHDQFGDLPVIDLSFLDSDPERVVKAIGEAAAEYGFMQVINHGIPLDLIKEHEALGKEFMASPLELKAKGNLGRFVGYNGGISHEELGMEQQTWTEGFTITFGPFFTLDPVVNSIWPEGNSRFVDIWIKFQNAIRGLNHTMHELFALSLCLEKDAFTKHITGEDKMLSVRWGNYPPSPKPDQILGITSHMDPNCLTLLHQDFVGGLQVKYKGEWIGVRPIEGAFVINIGDIMQAWSNDRYISTEHRVVANSKQPRLSISTFTSPNYSYEISAPEGLIDEDHPRKYRPFTAHEYLDMIHTTKKLDVHRTRLQNFLINDSLNSKLPTVKHAN